MESNWAIIFLVIVLIFLFSISARRSSELRRSPLKSPSSGAEPVYATAGTFALEEHPGLNLTSQASYPAPTSTGPSGHTGGRPRVVGGSDYLRNNPRSDLYSYRVGSEGEERVVERMRSVLDAQWTIFRNVDLGHHGGDIDIVLVGPGGIWAFEVKTYTGRFQVEKGSWYKEKQNGGMAKMRRGPGAQVRTNAIKLCEYLREQGVTHNSYVERAVIMSGDAPVEVISAGTTIWKLKDLDARLSLLKSYRRYSQEQVRLVVGVLEGASAPRAKRLH